MEKAYSRINWTNEPNQTTALSADNLNKMDKGIDDIDSRVVSIDGSKVNKNGDTMTGELKVKISNSTVTLSGAGLTGNIPTTGRKYSYGTSSKIEYGNETSEQTYGKFEVKDNNKNSTLNKDGLSVSAYGEYTTTVSAYDVVTGEGVRLNDTVPKTRKVAGIDLQDDITVDELKQAIGGGGSGTVKSVNDIEPDESGNIELTAEDVGAVSADELSPSSFDDDEITVNIGNQVSGGSSSIQLIYKDELTKVGKYFDKDLYSLALRFDSADAVRSIDLSQYDIDEFVNMNIIGTYPTGLTQVFDLAIIADRNNTYAWYEKTTKKITINSTFYATSFNALFTINE